MDKTIIIMFVIVTLIAIGVMYDAVSKGMWYVPVIVGIAIGVMYVLLGTDWFIGKPKQQNNSVNDRRTD